eukprot:GHVS01095777.1.p1 GENE.GHVS01095777.1~~GHVS01095777.1.p1  ORF type:complete len:627 (+),score=82.27 GHVS01095777.1:161-1882(+)
MTSSSSSCSAFSTCVVWNYLQLIQRRLRYFFLSSPFSADTYRALLAPTTDPSSTSGGKQQCRLPASHFVWFAFIRLFANVCYILILSTWKVVCNSRGRFRPSFLCLVSILLSCLGGCVWSFGGPVDRALWGTCILLLLYLVYLSFRYAAREFLTFQWDVLLLEAGLLAVCAAPAAASSMCPLAHSLHISVFRLLVFKLLFCSGVCKFASGCPRWAGGTAMHYHYWTQPLPNPAAWNFHWNSNKTLQCVFNTIVEAFVPFLMFATWWLRWSTALAFTVLMLMVYTTGNYGFFNILTIALSAALLDDSFFWFSRSPAPPSVFALSHVWTFGVTSFALFVYLVYTAATAVPLFRIWRRDAVGPPEVCHAIFSELVPLHGCNLYGLFATMTTSRHELVVEELHAINGKEQWVELSFPYKPSGIDRPPCWLWWGHMPRLDWRLWFVPLRLRSVLRRPSSSPVDVSQVYPKFWTEFLTKLVKRYRGVVEHLGKQPIDLLAAGPPRAVRVCLYDYRYTPPTGRSPADAFYPEGRSPGEATEEKRLQDQEDLKHWEIGSWWMRRRLRVVDVLQNYPTRPQS